MSVETIPSPETAGLQSRLQTPAGAAIIAVFVMLAMANTLFTGGGSLADNDSQIRLVEVRDLLGGQGWFDLMQYRMGLQGGFEMHWSRLVDAPIATIIIVADFLTGDIATAEAIAQTLWPAMVFGLTVYFIIRAAWHIGGPTVLLPATVIAIISLIAVGAFAPYSIDHHNVEIALTVASLAYLIEAQDAPIKALYAGITAALSVAVGMESAPFVAVAGVSVACLFLLRGDSAARAAAAFGIGLGLTGIAVMATTVAPARWITPACDAFSSAQAFALVVGGFGLAALSTLQLLRTNPTRRAIALAALGLMSVGGLALFFPQCLAAPYADLDFRQQLYWLNDIKEAQPAWSLFATNPSAAMGRFATPLLALVLVALAIRQRHQLTAYAFIGAFLLAAFLAAVWQVRVAIFATTLAVIPLSVWVSRMRSAQGTASGSLRMLLAWLMSINLVWAAAAKPLAKAMAPEPVLTGRLARVAVSECRTHEDLKVLAGLPVTTVLADINMGAAILANSHHRALAGPYHRNPGNIAAFEIKRGNIEQAHQLLVENGIGLLVVCRGVDELPDITVSAPASLHGRLMRGDPPDWLQRVEASNGQDLEIYRVMPTG